MDCPGHYEKELRSKSRNKREEIIRLRGLRKPDLIIFERWMSECRERWRSRFRLSTLVAFDDLIGTLVALHAPGAHHDVLG